MRLRATSLPLDTDMQESSRDSQASRVSWVWQVRSLETLPSVSLLWVGGGQWVASLGECWQVGVWRWTKERLSRKDLGI